MGRILPFLKQKKTPCFARRLYYLGMNTQATSRYRIQRFTGA
ncbi:hypothetical protein PPRY_a3496 [Pseudoalteromonas prydzensis ACAM 620]|nr:hypothetical protein [Pseudoalteromonas prydzensis ACAM 620]